MIPLPDILHPRPATDNDSEQLGTLIDLAFLGKESASQLDQALDAAGIEPSRWQAEHFAEDLFLKELISSCFKIERDGKSFPIHQRYIYRVLTNPPCELDTVLFRQAILRELESDAELRRQTEALHDSLTYLLTLFKAARSDARLNFISFRLDILRQARQVIDQMVASFASAGSGLRRLHEVGREIQESEDYRLLAALIEHEGSMATINLEVKVGADGSLRDLNIKKLTETTGNRFYRNPLQRWYDLLRMLWRRYSFDPRQVIDRLVFAVFVHISPAIKSLLLVLGQLEVYLASLTFAAGVRRRGLAMSLPEIAEHQPLHLEQLFNPLLLRKQAHPVPATVATAGMDSVTILTGPNSGGKTRLLQALGIAQVLGQCGLHVPCARAQMPLYQNLFVSLVERGGVDQPEGRLGSELIRIRTLFQTAPRRSLILLDELCSGTNPSEAIEIVSMVLRLLKVLAPNAFITTHFLDFANRLRQQPPIQGLGFLQVEIDEDQRSSFQFVPGVAQTSLAAGTARRLGITFEELSELIRSSCESEGERDVVASQPTRWQQAPTPDRAPEPILTLTIG
jgi:DNA mismatch repair protein MutS2